MIEKPVCKEPAFFVYGDKYKVLNFRDEFFAIAVKFAVEGAC